MMRTFKILKVLFSVLNNTVYSTVNGTLKIVSSEEKC